MAKFLCKFYDSDEKKTDKTKTYRNLNHRQIEKVITSLLSEETPIIDIYEYTVIFKTNTHKFHKKMELIK